MSGIHEIKLTGCTPETLLSYLKALGVLRLVAEQKDKNSRGRWDNGVFILETSMDSKALMDFFSNNYKPTPVIVPWSGGDFFGVNSNGNGGSYRNTPTSTAVIEAFIASTSERLSDYREAINCALNILQLTKITNKDKMKDKAKSRFISMLRSMCNEKVVRWIDACAVMSSDKARFSALLGSGGGSDGNTHFSDNFMQNLWDVLPDFNNQRTVQNQGSQDSLENALFSTPFPGLIPKRTSSLYDGGAVGGPNAGQGFERVSLGNPWSLILCIEGTILFAGSISKRQMETSGAAISFPFQTRLTPTSLDSSSDNESAGREIWMPLWNVFVGIHEIETILSEGRSAVGRSQSSRGVDFARAAASLGVDRGIDAFQRFGIIKGRVGGDNYYTGASFGRFDVRAKPDVDLLREADTWLNRFRGAASGDKVPPRFSSALRRIESAIFEFCMFGCAARFAEILCAFGNAERELAKGNKFREDKHIRPLSGLSPEWLRAANDNSFEFEIALSLAGIFDPEKKVEPIRANIEPVSYRKWKVKDFCDVWSNAGLSHNLLSVLERRMMDAEKLGCENLPLMSQHKANLDAISRYIAGEVDDNKIEELLWGMILVDHWKSFRRDTSLNSMGWSHGDFHDQSILPRPYALLKLLFLPGSLKTVESGVLVRPELAITALLRAGRTSEACVIAARRLRASGLTPMTYRRGQKPICDTDWQADGIDPVRLGAAILFPVSLQGILELRNLVLRPEKNQCAVQ